MPIIEIDVSDRPARHLGAVRLMSYMLFPDDAKLRLADEITLRTIIADWCSSRFAKEDRRMQSRVIRGRRLTRAAEFSKRCYCVGGDALARCHFCPL